MNKVIEVDFLPRETDVAFSWLDSIGDSARRILIVDNDKNSTHLVKVLLEKTGRYVVFEENDSTRAHQTARNFRPDLIFLDVVLPERDGGEIVGTNRGGSSAAIHANHFSHSARHENRGEHWSSHRRTPISRQANRHSRVNQGH